MWVVRSSILSPSDIHRVVSIAKAHHFNALFVQVRGRGDAFYQSALEPRSEDLEGRPTDFDPLAETLRQAHADGIQVHAWMNTCYVWGSAHRPHAGSHIVNSHPEWLARDAQNRFCTTLTPECEGAFVTPANLAARRHIHDVFVDVAKRYAIDGIHFDYIRYPNKGYDYSNSALTRFRSEMTATLSPEQVRQLDSKASRNRIAYPMSFPNAWQQFRRNQITEMVASISQDIKAIKPGMVISAAVFADRKDAYASRGQDWNWWLAQGYVDAVLPMAYGASTARVAAQISDAVSCARAAHRYAYAGIGSWHIPAVSTIGKIEAARSLGAQGIVLFSYGGITHDGMTTDYVDKVAHSCFASDACVPEMPWLKPALAPVALTGKTDTESKESGG